MLLRIIVGIALVIFAAGFLWFMAQVIWLGLKEFFKQHKLTASHRKQRGRTAPNRALKN